MLTKQAVPIETAQVKKLQLHPYLIPTRRRRCRLASNRVRALGESALHTATFDGKDGP
jgi:hypothetical protein